MSNEELGMSNERKNCLDCLHCKVSVKSTENCRLCFCAKIGRIAVFNDVFWLNKTLCNKFEDMSA